METDAELNVDVEERRPVRSLTDSASAGRSIRVSTNVLLVIIVTSFFLSPAQCQAIKMMLISISADGMPGRITTNTMIF
jgi:hypothetical protein